MSRVLKQLYGFAEKNKIFIDNFSLCSKKAQCYQQNNDYSIAIDYSKIHSIREEKQIVAEELSHCEYDLLYKLSDCDNPLQRQNIHQAEARARRFGAKKLVPLEELKKALRKYDTLHDIAEDLNVDDEIVVAAITSYRCEELL